jgi:hypothetical protein
MFSFYYTTKISLFRLLTAMELPRNTLFKISLKLVFGFDFFGFGTKKTLHLGRYSVFVTSGHHYKGKQNRFTNDQSTATK